MYDDSTLLATFIRAKKIALPILDAAVDRVESADKDDASALMKFLLTHPSGQLLAGVAKDVAEARSGEVAVADLVADAERQLAVLEKVQVFDCFAADGTCWSEYANLSGAISSARDKSKDCI